MTAISLIAATLVKAVILGQLAAGNSPADERPAGRLRVMSFNIHHGAGSDGKLDLARIAEVIRNADVDLVALQEVDDKTRRTGGVDQTAEIARLSGMHGAFGKAYDYDGGGYGQAILSRRPIESIEVRQLPGASDDEQRVAVFARFAAADGVPALLFVGTHLHHQAEAHRLAQANTLIKQIDAADVPDVIVAGDFNAVPGSKTMDRMLERWTDTTGEEAISFPATQPVKKIDWVLVPRDGRWSVVGAKVLDEPLASDHRPVVVELQFADR